MTKDDIIRMAREADFKANLNEPYRLDPETRAWREAFANLVAAAQKEADAKLCEEIEPFYGVMFANAIRARGTP